MVIFIGVQSIHVVVYDDFQSTFELAEKRSPEGSVERK
jgi:hypothetical protein